MLTMTQKKLDQVLRGALAVLVFAAQAACAEHAAEPRPAAAQAPSTQAAPADLARTGTATMPPSHGSCGRCWRPS
jgi:hypothetical protein